MIVLAAAGYFLFVGYVIYVQQEPFPGYALIGVLTLTYAAQAVVVYRKLYGRKGNPLETHAERAHAIAMTVKSSVFGCIVCVVFFAFVFTVDILDSKRWVPLAQSACLLFSSFLCLMGLNAPPRGPQADEFGETPAT
jgi:hypothetical protein